MQRIACSVVMVLSVLLIGCTQQHLAPITSVNTLDEQPLSQSPVYAPPPDETAPMQETSLPPEQVSTAPPLTKASQPQPPNSTIKTTAQNAMPTVPVPEQYTVEPGDTLGGIAHHYGLSYIYLAKLNQIDPPYVIRIGQVLKLKGKIPKQAHVVTKKSPVTGAAKLPAPSLQSTPKTSQTHTVDGVTWSWPAQGKVQNQFNPQGDVFHQGVDIISQGSTQVNAAARGKVVFSGQGAKGYGDMIILQHNNGYLSAYSQLSQINVKEGEQVKRGHQIAKMGTISGHAQMHFEVRHHGQPVDPLNYLPKE